MYSLGWASGRPSWKEGLALLRPVSPVAGCTALPLPGHLVESPLPIVLRCTDESNVTGSLAKIPGSILCKERQAKLDYTDGKLDP